MRDVTKVELESLGDRIAEQAAHLDAAQHRLLADIRAFDAAAGWYEQGARSCAHWLTWRVGWTDGVAREHVRVARRLGELPLLDDALRRGELSYAKVRAITRVATPANEALLLEMARHTTGAQLEEICRRFRAHQCTDKGFGPALGPEAAPHLADRLAAHGCALAIERSDWRLGPSDRALLEATLEGMVAAVREIASDGCLERWAARRRTQLARGDLRLSVGHLDLLALPG